MSYSKLLPTLLHQSAELQVRIPNLFQKYVTPLIDELYDMKVGRVDEINAKILGLVIRRLRMTARMSQDGLGAAAGINGQTISNIETGKVFPQPDTYHRVAAALNTTVQAIDAEARSLPRLGYAPESGNKRNDTVITVTSDAGVHEYPVPPDLVQAARKKAKETGGDFVFTLLGLVAEKFDAKIPTSFSMEITDVEDARADNLKIHKATTDDGQTVRGGTRSAAHNTNDDPGLAKRKVRPTKSRKQS